MHSRTFLATSVRLSRGGVDILTPSSLVSVFGRFSGSWCWSADGVFLMFPLVSSRDSTYFWSLQHVRSFPGSRDPVLAPFGPRSVSYFRTRKTRVFGFSFLRSVDHSGHVEMLVWRQCIFKLTLMALAMRSRTFVVYKRFGAQLFPK